MSDEATKSMNVDLSKQISSDLSVVKEDEFLTKVFSELLDDFLPLKQTQQSRAEAEETSSNRVQGIPNPTPSGTHQWFINK